MPMMQAMVEVANQKFNRVNIAATAKLAAALAPGQDLATGARALGIASDDAQERFLGGWPAGVKEAIRAATYDALTRAEGPLPVQFVWAPAYDYEVTVAEVAGTAASLGGMTVVLRSPIPGK